MNQNENRRALIISYFCAYNQLDIDGMLDALDPGVVFKHVCDGDVCAEVRGHAAFRALVACSRETFSARRLNLNSFAIGVTRATIGVSFQGTLAKHVPNGGLAGQLIQSRGWTELTFRDNRIACIVDVSDAPQGTHLPHAKTLAPAFAVHSGVPKWLALNL